MKHTISIITITLLLTLNANSQTRNRYVFDNFETSRGVQIMNQAQPPAPLHNPQTVSKTNKFIKKTVKQGPTMSLRDSVSFRIGPQLGQLHSGNTMSAGSSMGGFTTGDETIDSYIINSSRKYNIDPLLIYSQMHQESSFKNRAVSNKGASGLMQLMPATARRFGVSDIFDPEQNIDAGIKYMRWLLDTFGQDVSLALAGYNAGEGAVMKYGNVIPPYSETQEYVRRISSRYDSIRDPNALKMPIRKASNSEIAKLDKKVAAPLTAYERAPMTVRLPDGRLRLVNQ